MKQIDLAKRAVESAIKKVSEAIASLSSSVDSTQLDSIAKSILDKINETFEILLKLLENKDFSNKKLCNNIFGKKGEKILGILPGIEDFFKENFTILKDYIETKKTDTSHEEANKNEEKKRKRRSSFVENDKIDEKIIYIDIPEDQKTCAGCGSKLTNIGYEETFELEIIPAKIIRNTYRKLKYACKECEGADIIDENKPIITAKFERFYPKSIFSVSLIAFIICLKFIDSLPLYRISSILLRYRVDIPRQMLSNAVIYTYEKIKRLYELMGEKIQSLHCLNCDETPFRLLHTSDKQKFSGKKQMWVCCGDRHFQIIYYFVGDRTASTVAQILGEHFKGVIQTDGMKSYMAHCATHPQVAHAGCWSHVRRHFTDVLKSEKDPIRRKALLEGDLGVFLGRIDSLFVWEKKLRKQNLSDNCFLEKRKEIIQPILDEIHAYAILFKEATDVKIRPISKAVDYMLNLWDILVKYLDYAELGPSNNIAENSMRKVAVGRKNWLFCNSWEGAEATAAFMTFTATAKLYELNPSEWLTDVLSQFSLMERENRLAELLPWNYRKNVIDVSPVPAASASQTSDVPQKNG